MDWSFIDDAECIPMVEFFNQEGLTTKMCCSGHKDDLYMSLFWISFAPNITEKEIEIFLRKYDITNCGRFAQRLLPGWNRDWFYCAASVEAAALDLYNWKNNINKYEQ